MKKHLIIFGLLVCTTGIALADEVATGNFDKPAIQQVEVQNQIDKTTFENFDKNKKFNDSLRGDKKTDKIKFDKSVNNKQYKNFDKKGKYSPKNTRFKSEYKGNRPDLRKGQKADIFAPQRKPLPNKYMGHRPSRRYGEFKGGYRPSVHKAHKLPINNYKRHSHNIRKQTPKRV